MVLQAAVGVRVGRLPLPTEGAEERGRQVLPGQVQGGEFSQHKGQKVQEKEEEKERTIEFSLTRLPYIYFPRAQETNIPPYIA